MCGIFGKIQFDGRPIEVQSFLKQLNTMTHRGPDGYGLVLANLRTGHAVSRYNRPPGIAVNCYDTALGHRRLAIIDRSNAAAQPMTDQEGRLWLTFNGEIYNFGELRKELLARGHVFSTNHSDSEALLYAFKEWGEGCLERLRGMFAFAVLDLKTRHIFFARDRIGKKPLYYRSGPDGLQFASELKAILIDPQVPQRIDPVSLVQYLMFNYIPAPRTIYDGIHKLPAGHCAWVDLMRPEIIRVKEYWKLQYQVEEEPSLEVRMEEFDAEFAEAVRLRMISDVPLGVLLSGGIDSTAVVRTMRRLTNGPIRTFSVGFEEEERNELKWAREVARRYGTEHHEKIIRPDAAAILSDLVGQYDEPFGDSSALPTYWICRTAKEHVTTVLSGDGGDELLAGYNRYETYRKLAQFDGILPRLRHLVLGMTDRLLPQSVPGKRRLFLLAKNPYERYLEQMGKSAALEFLTPEIQRAAFRKEDPQAFFRQAWDKSPQESLSRLQYVDTKTYLPEDVLVKLDRASMLNSLEARCPFLDHKLIELVARIPAYFKYHRNEKKYLLKQILLPDMGREFLSRRKRGFSLPLNQWLRGELSGYVKEHLAAGNLPDEINRPSVERFLNSYMRGILDGGRSLWSLLVLSLWCERYRVGRMQ
jgi:asparagine synthase (glutamine-hydrolysing)